MAKKTQISAGFKWSAAFNLHLRGDYTTRFGNFILYYNFLTNSLKFIKYTLSGREFHKEDNCDIIFFTKNQHFWENHKKITFYYASWFDKRCVISHWMTAPKNCGKCNWPGLSGVKSRVRPLLDNAMYRMMVPIMVQAQ